MKNSNVASVNFTNEIFNSFAKGKNVEARYIQPELSEYTNNPLILSLPRILTTDEAIEKLSFFPEFDENLREMQDHLRHHKLETGLRFFSPLDVHLDLERRISCLLRAGYIERNPLKHEYYKKVNHAFESFSQYGDDDSYFSTKYHGFNIVGISGVGKTQTVERILNLYPQVIRHSNFQGKNFTSNQLVWLKLDCPFDGSTKGLCLNFFQAVDRIFNTNYLKNYGTRKTTDEMLPYIALVASLHFLGVLVIDEIQRLNLAKSGGAERMLNFFTHLVNSVGVPVIMVGTYKALPLLSSDFSQMRRGTGQGDLVWDRMAFDEQWEVFLESLWNYQYTRLEAVLGGQANLARVLYEETQGITDLAIKTFIFAQQRAIENGTEKITSEIIRSVVKDKFKILRPALEAMRGMDKRALELYEDIFPVFRDDLLARTPPPKIVGQLNRLPEIKQKIASNNSNNSVVEQSGNGEQDALSHDDKENKLLVFKQSTKRQIKNKINTTDEKALTNLLRSSTAANKCFYQTMLDNGYIRVGDEFVNGGVN